VKKIKDWANKNEGFLALIVIIGSIINSITDSINLRLPKILDNLIYLLNISVSIPLYSIIIILVFFLLLIRNILPYWSNFFIKSIRQKVIDIPSDQDSIFIGSKTFKEIPFPCNAFKFNDSGYWENYKTFPELNNSYWISHTQLISDDEAIKGGEYQFERKFQIDYNKSNIESAKIYLTVDDECKIFLNEAYIGNFYGIDVLSSISIKDYLYRGENILKIFVINTNSPELTSTIHSKKIGKKGSLNPYGIRFLIRIINK
jgi:hypothetical protein